MLNCQSLNLPPPHRASKPYCQTNLLFLCLHVFDVRCQLSAVICHVLGVRCHLQHVTNPNSHRPDPPQIIPPTMYRSLVCKGPPSQFVNHTRINLHYIWVVRQTLIQYFRIVNSLQYNVFKTRRSSPLITDPLPTSSTTRKVAEQYPKISLKVAARQQDPSFYADTHLLSDRGDTCSTSATWSWRKGMTH